jgi:ubiquinone/menaquinone biosynthesis C-methylase UbiE
MNVFDEMGKYWAEIAAKNTTQEQINFLKSALKPEGLILDIACGTARHSIALGKEGYSMVGLDVSVKLLRIAKKHSSQLELVRADMRFLPFKPETFSAAVSMDTSLGYLPSEADDAQSLNEARRVLRQDGGLIVDVFNRKRLMDKYMGKAPSPKLIEYPSFFLMQTRTISDNGNWLCDLWKVREKETEQLRIFEHKVRLYERDHLEALLEKAGFAVRQVFGDYEGEKFTPNSPRLILIAEA